MREDVGRAREPACHAADPLGRRAVQLLGGDVGEPEVAHPVAVAVVPLSPAGGKLSDLPAAHPDVPRLGDHLDALECRVGDDRGEKRMFAVEHHLVVAAERGGEIEAEPVDLYLVRPVAQRIQHESLGGRQREVEGVAAAGHVDVVAVGHLAVVVRVVETAETRRRTHRALLGRVVVDDVEYHLEPGLVQELHHALELAQHRARAPVLGCARGVGAVGREEVEGVVAPVVAQPLLDEALLAHELLHREELDRRHAEFLQVGDVALVGESGVGAAQLLGDRRVELAQPLRVGLVDDGVVEGRAGLDRPGPVELLVLHVAVPLAGRGSRETTGIGIDEVAGGVERMVGPRRAGGAQGVVRAGHEAVRAARPDAVVVPGERDRLDDPVRVLHREDAQLDARRARGEHPDAAVSTVEHANAQIAQHVGLSHEF